MDISWKDNAHLLFLFSDTGGGHRSAAEAIIEALTCIYGARVRCTMVDIFKEYAPFPLSYLPELYPLMVKAPPVWGIGYRLTDGEMRSRLIMESAWPYVKRSAFQIARQHRVDIVVSVHPIAVAPVLRALKPDRPPFVTVVTDLATTHAFWFNPETDLCIVPTEQAFRRALSFGLAPQKVKVVGLPVSQRFTQPMAGRNALRDKFAWPKDRAVVLIMGGGEGMGPIAQIAEKLAATCRSAALVIVCGRNRKLEEQLKAIAWPIPTFVYGFVRQIAEFMHAADILVTKAGPSTIAEALVSGLPMVLYRRLPGQEDGNVPYVVSHGAGVWAPRPDQVAHAVQSWLSRPASLRRAREACKRLAKPDAANEIARLIMEELDEHRRIEV